MPYETDERLKSFLDANQLHREQLCLAILAMDKRFSNVRPRHPRGGPDGGRDIEALFKGDQLAFGAVGFINQADDSDEKKKRISAKFKDDLTSALAATPRPDAFVFLTNMNLTMGEKTTLESDARAAGTPYCEIFDRERLRIALDTPDGFALRFQYLRIPLSEEEQASFFAKWGDDVNSLIATGFQEVKSTLDRILFLQEASSPLASLLVAFELDRVYQADEIGHFRAFCSLYLKEPKLKVLSILFGSADKADRMRSDIAIEKRNLRPGIKAGIGGGQWEQHFDVSGAELPDIDKEEKYKQVGSSSAIGQDKVQFISIRYSTGSFIRFDPVFALRDFDEAMFLPLMNESLARKLKTVHVFANEYKLMEISEKDLQIDTTAFEPNVPVVFTSDELADPWVRIRPNMSSTFHLRFSEETPQRRFAPNQVKDSLPRRGTQKKNSGGA